MSFIISGSVTSSFIPSFVSNVTMSFFSESVLVATASTDSNGQYTASFEATWSGYSEPTHSEFLYSTPTTQSYSLVSTDQNDQDFNVYKFVSGSGVDGDEYIIYTADELNMVRYEGSASFELGNDIDLSSYSDWTPISNFSGSFDGNNKVIENLTITTLGIPDTGFFGRINFSTGFRAVKNVTLNSASVYFTSGDTSGNKFIGGLIGRMNMGSISDFSNNKIINSVIGVNFTLNNHIYNVGGLIGELGSSAGSISSCSVENCTIVRKSDTLTAQRGTGGFIGFNDRPMSKCFVNNCIVESEIQGGLAYIGGFIGRLDTNATTTNCYVANTLISSSAGEHLSGFAAVMAGGVTNCYAAVSYSGYDDITDINPFYSEDLSGVKSPTNCYYDSGTIDGGHAGSTNVNPLTTSEMKDKTSYNNWNFDSIWAINILYHSGYPFFYYENPEVTSKIEGRIITSLNSAMENVSMSFYASGTSIIDYTTYTDEFGLYTQSVAHGWSGSLVPTSSEDAHEFFSGLNYSESAYFPATVSDKTYNTVGVKNYSSGSGNDTNPYIVLDHEDMHNVRYRTGSVAGPTHPHYKLGSDIDLTPIVEWIPIPNYTSSTFRGGFDGDNYTISSMSISTVPTIGAVRKHFGLFGQYFPVNSGSRNINFDNCSINLSGTLPNNSGEMLYGILAGNYYRALTTSPDVRIRNVHVNHSIIKVDKSSPTSVNHWMGGIAGNNNVIGGGQIYGHGLISCSVQNTIIDVDLHGGGATTVRIGGLTGDNWLPDSQSPVGFAGIFYSFVKDCTLHSNTSTGGNYFSGFAGFANALVQDSYILNCNMSSSHRIGPAGWGMNEASTRVYVAGIDYGNTNIDNKYQFLNYDYDDGPTNTGFCYWESGSELFTKSASVVGVTGSTPAEMILSESFVTFDFENVWSRKDSKNDAYPYLGYETFLVAIAGLTLYYDSRIGYVSASNTWTDLSGNGVDATTVNTFPSGGHLYFGTEFGSASAEFSSLQVSNSFAIEMFIAPTTQSSKMYLFSTVSGSFPRIDGYMSGSNVYFGFQSGSVGNATYISSSSPLNTDKFNHIAFQVAPNSGTLWINGTFEQSTDFTVGDGVWSGGTIGILDTEQTNPYYGYVDVFKVWNGPVFNSTVQDTINTYHVSRSYFIGLPGITYPSP